MSNEELLSAILQELRRIRYSLLGAEPDLAQMDDELAAQSAIASTESESPSR